MNDVDDFVTSALEEGCIVVRISCAGAIPRLETEFTVPWEFWVKKVPDRRHSPELWKRKPA